MKSSLIILLVAVCGWILTIVGAGIYVRSLQRQLESSSQSLGAAKDQSAAAAVNTQRLEDALSAEQHAHASDRQSDALQLASVQARLEESDKRLSELQQQPSSPPIASQSQQQTPSAPTETSSETGEADVQQLVAPIALDPDPLLAVLLPAATFPDDVQAAQQWLQTNPTPTDDEIDAQNWPPAVKAMVHYPTVLAYMANNDQWTQSLGSAFSDSQPRVFTAIQDLRAAAVADGSLASNDQIAVVTSGRIISIQPADPDVLVVPTYDPMVVYESPTVIEYGPRIRIGPWLGNGIVWNSGGYLFVGDWRGPWIFRAGHWHHDPHWIPAPHWVHDDRWGRRPTVARHAWAHSAQIHGGFHPVAHRRGRPKTAGAEQSADRDRAAGDREDKDEKADDRGKDDRRAEKEEAHPSGSDRGDQAAGGDSKPGKDSDADKKKKDK